jgi:DNA repair exonuclease SbcCD ATPase subunit
MKIEFISITIQNFLSFGNIPITFNYVAGIHAVTGNLIPNTTIRNGIGKTTLLAESLTYLLYGKTLRNINKDEIINTTNRDGCFLSGIFKIGDKVYKVDRGIKPNVLKIWELESNQWLGENTDWECAKQIQLDSIKHTQTLLEEKIKISYTCFTNMIILNVNHSIPFLSMDPAAKRSVLEDILSLSIYGRMSDKAKSKHLNAKSDMSILENDLKNAVNTLSLTKEKRESLLNETMKFENEKQKRISDLKNDIHSYEQSKNKIDEKIRNVDFGDILFTLKQELNNIIIKKNDTINNKSKLETELKMNNSVLVKLEHNDHCPLCQTPTSNPLISEYIHNLKNKVNELIDNIKKCNEEISEYEKNQNNIAEKISKVEDNIDKLKSAKNKIRELELSISNCTDNLNREINRKLEIKEIISHEEYEKLEDLVKIAEDKFNLAQKDFKYNKFIRNILGEDGVRKYVILKVLPILNRKVNFYLSMLGSDYTITFDNELKEKLIARNKDIRSYESFSGGEKKRIDLALLLALMDVSKERNSIDTNILVLDEILDTSLDTVGAESFLEHLKNGFKVTCPDKCIYIISHKKELGEELFDSIIHLIKKNDFTSIDKII